ncbi:MAG: DUF2530 domain-containing protein [Jiangellaceae bacterium]
MARRRRRAQEPPQVHPFDVDGVRTVAVGTVLWAAAFVILALNRGSLDEQGLGWWLWTCLSGVGLGLLGLEYTRKRRDAIAQALLDEEADRPDEPSEGEATEPAPVDQAQWEDAVPPPVEQDHDRPPGVRRARRNTRVEADETSDDGTTYRGRRARRR